MFGSAQRVALGNQITTPPLIPAGQPTESNIKILLPFNGDDGSTANIIDLSSTAKTYVPTGGGQLDTAQKKWGTASGLMAATGSSGNRFETTDAAALEPGSSPFCMECWFRFTGVYGTDFRTIFSHHNSAGSNDGLLFRITSTKQLQFELSTTGSGYDQSVTSLAQSINPDTDHHIAMTRDSSNDIRLFLRGKLIQTTNIGAASASNHTQPWAIGAHRFSGSNWDGGVGGWIDDFRWIVGEPLYTVPFIPPIAPHPTGKLEFETTSDNLLLEDGTNILEIE